MRRPVLLSSALAALLLSACGSCDRQTPSEPSEPGADGARALAPLPAPPAIEVQQEALPGTADELAVVAARPQGSAQGDIRPTITFSAPVKALGTIEADEPPPATIRPAVKGEWKWLGSASVEFVPAEPLPMSTAFEVTVEPGLTALNGAKLSEPYTFSFQTPAPQVQQVEPWNGYRWLSPEQTFKLTFNQPVRDLATHAALELDGGSRRVALTVVGEIDVAKERAEKLRANGWRGEGAEQGFRSRQMRYELKPAEPLPADSEVRLVIAAALEGVDGPLTLGNDATFEFRTHGPMAIQQIRPCGDSWRYCSWGPLVIQTSNEVDPASVKGKLTIVPEVEIDWDALEVVAPAQWMPDRSPEMLVPGRFRPGVTYEVRIAAGIKDVFGQSAPAAKATVTMSDLEPTLDIYNALALLESSGDRALPIRAANLDVIEAELWRVTPEQAAPLLIDSQLAWHGVPEDAPIPVQLDVSGARNVMRDWPLDLSPVLGEDRSGLVIARVWTPEISFQNAENKTRIFAQVSDLAVHARFGAASGVLWVTRLSDGKVVPGATLRVLDRTGAERWRGVSDEDGLARIPGLVELIPGGSRDQWSTPPALAVAELDGQVAVTASTWNEGLHPSAFNLPVDWNYEKAQPLGVVFTDRGIYRPGDEVFVRGLVRNRKLGRLTSPAGVTAKLVVRSSRGDEIFKTDAKVNAFGSFSTTLKIPADAALGGWDVTAEFGRGLPRLTGSFRVEEYRPPQFQVDVDVAKREAIAGEELTATVLARYLHGGAMAEVPVRWSMAAQSQVEFTPASGRGFSFGPQTWMLDDGAPAPSRTLSGGGETRTDEKGFVTLALGKPNAPGGQAWEYTVEAEVADVNRQRLANRATVTVHPAAWYVGLRTAGDGFFEVGKPAALEAIAVTISGERKVGAPIELEVRRREWKSIRRRGGGGHWYYESQPVETKVHEAKLTSEENAVRTELTPEQPGFYVVEARTRDDAGREQVTRTSFYVVGPGWVSWQRDATDRIDLVADKTLYDVGETARVLIKNPWQQAEAIITVEREGVREVRRMTLTSAATVVDIPIDEDAVPNLFVGALLFRGRVESKEPPPPGADPGRPAIAVGYAQLKVEKKSRRLKVSVRPDAEEKRPGDKVKLSLQVTDAAGAPARAELAVWAVDEGVLRLTGYRVPDPVEAIYRQQGIAVFTADALLHLVHRRDYSEKGSTAGGSGGTDASGSGFRSRFKTTVLFEPHVVTDASGKATVELTLPDNLTTFRIMAIAATEGELFGAGESKLVVSKPLLALPALPRAARVGDSFEAGVVVHGKRPFPELKVTAQAEGLTLEGGAEQTASLADGKPREVRFRFKATAPGVAKLRFRVEGGGERDGVEQTVPVLLPIATEAVAVAGDTTGEATEAIVPPEGVRPDIGGLTVTLASTAFAGYDGAMRQLVEYPYGCVEQLSSRLVPFIALRELKGQFQETGGMEMQPQDALLQAWLGESMVERFGSDDPDEVVRQTVRGIEQLQNTDGGYRYWSTSRCSSGWASAYSVLALARAQEVGYPVDAEGLKRGKAFVANALASGQGTRCGWGGHLVDDPTRVFALYVLARTGDARPSWYPELYARRDTLPLFAKAMLADAMFIGRGDRAQAKQLLQEVLNHAKETPTELYFQEQDPLTYAALWSSDTRTTAIVLQTLTDISPDHPYVAKMARYLGGVRQPSGAYRNTQEAAFTLMAIAEVVRTKERQVPNFVAQVGMGRERLASERFEGRSLQPKKVEVPIGKLAESKGKLPLTFAKKGEGVLYYAARLQYAPAEMPTTPLDRGVVVQRWFEPYSGGGQARKFFAGELVRVRVRVGSHMARRNLAIEVPLPAGLEAVDTSLASTARLPQSPADEEGMEPDYEYESEDDLTGSESPWAYEFYSPFNHTEMRDDRVVLFADELPPGVHVTSFVARATTPGDFVLPPAHAEEMYAPEVFGRSDGGRLEVVLPAPVAVKSE